MNDGFWPIALKVIARPNVRSREDERTLVLRNYTRLSPTDVYLSCDNTHKR